MLAIIETLLNDNATMVLGSAVATFNEVCPNEWGMVHRNFRKLCGLLADMDEWGQIAALHMLTRYARTQFTDPDAEIEAKKAAKEKRKREKAARSGGAAAAKATEGESDESSDEESGMFAASAVASEASMEPDHRLLLRSALPLLQSRNTGVVLAVATLYNYLAPRSEHTKIAKSLIRVLHGRKESKFVVLNGILTFVESNPDMFRPHLSDFFIESAEPTYIRKIKIDIITLLANEGNISRILREFKSYVSQEEKEFVKATIQAIGRCALRLPEVTETCMHCLTSLIGTHSEAAVAEAIVVVKKLLQVSQGEDDGRHNKSGTSTPNGKPSSSSSHSSKKGKFSDVIKHMAKLLDTVKNPQARASIAWIISEHVSQLQTVAPDVLRKLAKSFPEEDLLVKLQALNLGVKLYLTNPEQTTLLFQYILNLAKYDTSYDLRDRARLIRRIVFNTGDKAHMLHEHAMQLFLTKKPVPSMEVITPTDSEGEYFFPGSISSLLGHTAYGYLRVPAWAPERIDSEHRNPIKREWENFAYGGSTGMPHVPAPVTAISWNQVQHHHPNATSFSSAAGAPGAPIASPQAAHSVAGFASREEYERNFWGDDSSSDSDSSSSSSRSRSGSSSSSSGSSSYSSSGSDTESDDEGGPSRPSGSIDDALFGSSAPVAASPAPEITSHATSAVEQADISPQSPSSAAEQEPSPAKPDSSSTAEHAPLADTPLVVATPEEAQTPASSAALEEDSSQENPVASADDFVPESSGSDWLSGDATQESLI